MTLETRRQVDEQVAAVEHRFEHLLALFFAIEHQLEGLLASTHHKVLAARVQVSCFPSSPVYLYTHIHTHTHTYTHTS